MTPPLDIDDVTSSLADLADRILTDPRIPPASGIALFDRLRLIRNDIAAALAVAPARPTLPLGEHARQAAAQGDNFWSGTLSQVAG